MSLINSIRKNIKKCERKSQKYGVKHLKDLENFIKLLEMDGYKSCGLDVKTPKCIKS